MQGNYFDIGVNLTHESFNSDYRVVINDAILKNIKKICLTGTSIEDSKKCIEIANEFKKILSVQLEFIHIMRVISTNLQIIKF